MGPSKTLWAFFLWGLLSFVSLPFIHHFEEAYYLKKEPFFTCPVPSQYNLAPLRNDTFGKGYFGASRNGGRTHEGIDLLGRVGDPVFAAKSGRVMRVERSTKGYGQLIEIGHPNGLSTIYAHLSKIDIKTHDWIKQGSLIGKTGKSGNAMNPKILPHLHFEVRDHQKSINPNQLISFKLA